MIPLVVRSGRVRGIDRTGRGDEGGGKWDHFDMESSAVDRHLRPSPEVRFQLLDSEAVLLHLGNETYYGLNAVGTRFWQLLVEAPSVRAAEARLLEEFEVDAETLRLDLGRLIDDLLAADIVRELPSGA